MPWKRRCAAAPFLKRAQDAAPRAQALTDYKAVMALADVEAVIIATPTPTHKDIALAALQAGKHVYCEAPLATAVDDARAIAQAAKGAGKQIFACGLQGGSNAADARVEFGRGTAEAQTAPGTDRSR